MDLLNEMHLRVVPGDGAMGTELLAAGASLESCLEELCVSAPENVVEIHTRYLVAGARVIRTNSFGANGVRLARHGLEHHVNEINWSASQLARQTAREYGALVAGSVGPLGISAEEAAERGIDREAIFREQIGALLDGGAQCIMLETFTDVRELALALYVKQSLHHCPAICSLACPASGVLADGTRLADAVEKLRAADADIIGVNCTDSPQSALALIAQVADGEAVSAFPSAGLPVDGRYDFSPEDFAKTALNLATNGARLIGGCCGIGPAHIAAMVKALASVES
jgi:homocysteine S-methyltransferase